MKTFIILLLLLVFAHSEDFDHLHGRRVVLLGDGFTEINNYHPERRQILLVESEKTAKEIVEIAKHLLIGKNKVTVEGVATSWPYSITIIDNEGKQVLVATVKGKNDIKYAEIKELRLPRVTELLIGTNEIGVRNAKNIK